MGGGVAGCTPDLEDADVTAGGGERRVKREDDVLVGPQLRHVGKVLGDRFAGAGDRVAVDQPVLQQMFHDHRHSADVALLQSESGHTVGFPNTPKSALLMRQKHTRPKSREQKEPLSCGVGRRENAKEMGLNQAQAKNTHASDLDFACLPWPGDAGGMGNIPARLRVAA